MSCLAYSCLIRILFVVYAAFLYVVIVLVWFPFSLVEIWGCYEI